MNEIRRRTVLGALGSLVVSIFAEPVMNASIPAGAAWQGDQPADRLRRRALATLRLLNTTENSVFHSSAAYWHHTELAGAPVMQRMIESLPPQLAGAFGGFDQLPEFQSFWSLDTDRRGYSMTLVEAATGFTLRTDQSGVIREGWAQRAADDTWDIHAVVSRPLSPGEPRQLPHGPRASIRNAVGRVVSFFVPALHADNSAQCCIGACGGGAGCREAGACCCCEEPYCPTCPWLCCNSGYTVCTWCCLAYNCGCFFECLS